MYIIESVMKCNVSVTYSCQTRERRGEASGSSNRVEE